ncbi:MAG TPA: metal ABC transporter permease [Candidatus Saccharimonadales bacterium]|nr:metal ABC transporter permease [Candidatus Saccharimonadales bacterium]
MFEIFRYAFIVRGLEAGVVIAILAPLIGIFLVLRRYSLIADTLSHVSLAGIAIGLLLKINPVISAIIATSLSSFVIEKLRLSKKVYGESALSIFLSGSLALAVVLISAARGFNVNLFNYLFGSIATVRAFDVTVIGILGTSVFVLVVLFYKELVFVSFDEESAKVAGIPTGLINTLFIILCAITISVAIPVIGILLISALVVIPVVAALQLKLSFVRTILAAEVISILCVIAGIIISFYLDLSPGGTIVLLTLFVFALTFLRKMLP